MNKLHALFPISVDNKEFTTKRALNAISALRKYASITFFVADKIQIYNTLAKCGADPDRWAAIDWSARGNRMLQERSKWIQRLRNQLHDWPVHQDWNVVGVSEISDHAAYEIARNVSILFQIDDNFRRDVRLASSAFLQTHSFPSSEDISSRLSVSYLLEEIALNVRLRVSRGLSDEYYMGNTLIPLLRLYEGAYLKNVRDLVNTRSNVNSIPFRFYEWVQRSGVVGQWIEVKDRSQDTLDSNSKVVSLGDRRDQGL